MSGRPGRGHAPFDKVMLRRMFAYGAPLTAAGLATALHMTLDRFALGYFQGSAAAGQFAAIADFTRQCVALPVAGVFSAIVPAVMRTHAAGDPEETQRQLSSSGELLAAGVFPSVVGLMLVSPHLAALVFGAEFRDTAEKIMPILAIAWIAYLMAQQYVHLSYQLAEKPMLLIAYSVGLALISFCLIVPGAKFYGVVGTAAALAGAEICGLMLGIFLTRYGYPLPAISGGLLRVGLAAAAMVAVVMLVGRLLPWPPGWQALVVLAMAGAVSHAAAAVALDVAGTRLTARRYLGLSPSIP
jgi:O-antigen/teichoic acid export membrane protein